MKCTIFLIFLFPLFAHSQITIKSYERVGIPAKSFPHMPIYQGVIILTSGDTVMKGTFLKLGKGSLPNGDYNYIATPSNTMEAKLKRTTKLTSIEVKEIIKSGSEKYGYRCVVKAEGSYLIQLEDAIATGEIIFNTVSPKNNR
jgi:hypothetical protein